MSTSLTDNEQISKSPLNNSKSKYLFSFSKSKRFADPPKLQTNYEFYNITKWRGNRSTTMGYGNKYDFTKENKDKCQNYYDVSKKFNPSKLESPSYTFAFGRDKYEKVRILNVIV